MGEITKYLIGFVVGLLLPGLFAGLTMQRVVPALNLLGVAYIAVAHPVVMACLAFGGTCENKPPEQIASWFFTFEDTP